jgi:hypothetical protein
MRIDRKTYARMGAEARIREISAELASIWRMFPDLQHTHRSIAVSISASGEKRRRRRPMSAAQRKAVSGWMRKYWAKRRAAKDVARKRAE